MKRSNSDKLIGNIKEFSLQEWLEDAEDLLDIRAVKKDEVDAPTINLSELEKEFGI